MLEAIIILLGFWNSVTFVTMGLDKWKAIRGKSRIPEKTLLLMALVFGSAGATLGMYFFRHKTKHSKFRLGLPAMVILHLAIVLLIFK